MGYRDEDTLIREIRDGLAESFKAVSRRALTVDEAHNLARKLVGRLERKGWKIEAPEKNRCGGLFY